MSEAPTEWLSAAECALRTGLTVRALRVYENHGLITPRRTAAGWRRYGAEELLKLNEVGLLKILGLTLTKIRDLTGRSAQPGLRQLLELQLNTWKHRRAEAGRGLAIAEAALERLRSSRSLSIEELCSLIRSFGMNTATSDTSVAAGDEPVTLDSATLHRYAGYYLRNRALGISTITRRDNMLFLEPIGQPALELEPIGEAEFAVRPHDLVLRFEQAEESAARRLVIWQRGVMLKLVRIDTDSAEIIKRAIAQRIDTRTPIPGGEEAVRLMIETVRSGNPNYDRMSSELAQVVRAQLPYWQTVGQYFGAVTSIEFLYVSNQGWDIYGVQHERDVQRYRIALADDGKVYGFGEASLTAERRTLA